MKLKIINADYYYGEHGLTRFSQPEEKPWKVCGSGEIDGFPTHAEAIAYADKLTRGRQETPIGMTHPTTDWDVQVLPQYVRHYLDAGWTIRKGPQP